MIDAMKPCTTSNELYLTVSSLWKHDVDSNGNFNISSPSKKTFKDGHKSDDIKRKEEYKFLMYDIAKKRVRRLVLDGIITPRPAQLFYTEK